MATPLDNTPAFLEQVKRRPVIWDTRYKFYGDRQRLSAAWRQICKINWPDFDTMTADDKRMQCLEMQKKWRTLRESFKEHHRKEKGNKSNHPHAEEMAFLVPVISSDEEQKTEGGRPAKRRCSEALNVTSSCGSGGSSSQENREQSADEDRQFLMSLVSFMQDVPRTSKLALRADIMQLIIKYTQPQNPSDSPQY